MLIEKTIELQLKGPVPPNGTYTPITGYFHDKTKFSLSLCFFFVCEKIWMEGY